MAANQQKKHHTGCKLRFFSYLCNPYQPLIKGVGLVAVAVERPLGIIGEGVDMV